jgi:hypothetical protein
MERLNAEDQLNAFASYLRGVGDELHFHGRYHVECIGPDGKKKWEDDIDNVVTTAGKNAMLTAYITGCYMGLKGTGTAVAGDTQSSHSGWLEVGGANSPTYSGNRPVPSFATASGGSISTASPVAFSITGSGTIAGCFINVGGSATKDSTTGTLLSAGDFSGGSKTVASGDTVNVTYTLSV